MSEHAHSFLMFDPTALVVRCECGAWISAEALTLAVPEMRAA